MFKLKFVKASPAREGSALGDPTADAFYTACVWGNAGHLIVEAKAPAGAAWAALKDKGYKYLDKTLSEDGIKLFKVLAGSTGKAKETKVIVSGKGTNLPDPVLPLSTPVNVTAQVIDSANGICWSASFDDATVKKNEANSSNTIRTSSPSRSTAGTSTRRVG